MRGVFTYKFCNSDPQAHGLFIDFNVGKDSWRNPVWPCR